MPKGFKRYMRKYARSIHKHLLPKRPRIPREIPICIFCYHKSGTSLMGKVFREIAHANNWRFKTLAGKQNTIPEGRDIVLYAHSVIDFKKFNKPFIGVHIIRDPRDIIVSGYLYHRRTQEKWCINTDFSLDEPILSPRVPYSEEYKSEVWKKKYIKSLGGISYQQNLLRRSKSEGLKFEMDNFSCWTIEHMMEWDYGKKNILEVKFEDVMSSYDRAFQDIFEHLGFTNEQVKESLRVVEKHDLGRKSVKEINRIEHVSSRETNRWVDYFEGQHKNYFHKIHGSALVDLGYEKDNIW